MHAGIETAEAPITEAGVQRFVGGHATIQNKARDTSLYGPIDKVAIVGDEMHVTLKWCAQNDGGFKKPCKAWSLCDHDVVVIDMIKCHIINFDTGSLYTNANDDGDSITFVLPNGREMINRSLVAGLAQHEERVTAMRALE